MSTGCGLFGAVLHASRGLFAAVLSTGSRLFDAVISTGCGLFGAVLHGSCGFFAAVLSTGCGTAWVDFKLSPDDLVLEPFDDALDGNCGFSGQSLPATRLGAGPTSLPLCV